MRLTHVRVQNYRCVRDTGWFKVERAKTILVGPNEAGKTAVLGKRGISWECGAIPGAVGTDGGGT